MCANSWIFKTASYDIGFALLHNENGAVIPLKRIHANEQVQEGSFSCTKTGKCKPSQDSDSLGHFLGIR